MIGNWRFGQSRRRAWAGLLLLSFFCGLGLGLASTLAAHSVAAPDPASDAATTVDAGPAPATGECLLLLPPDDAPAPRVVIYCTHAGEEYAGQRRVNGKAGGVMTAAAALADAFEARGVGVIFDQTLHDSPSYDDAYQSSLTSLSAIAAQYPEIEVYFDIHRDSLIEGVDTTLETAAGSLARMMFVVGTDEKFPHPGWRQNYEFACAVTAELEALQPGLTREPRLYSGRYNQHIAAAAALVEIGSNGNSVQEACRSAELLAEAVCRVRGWQ